MPWAGSVELTKKYLYADGGPKRYTACKYRYLTGRSMSSRACFRARDLRGPRVVQCLHNIPRVRHER